MCQDLRGGPPTCHPIAHKLPSFRSSVHRGPLPSSSTPLVVTAERASDILHRPAAATTATDFLSTTGDDGSGIMVEVEGIKEDMKQNEPKRTSTGDTSEGNDDDDDPLTCREKLPSPPSAFFEEEEELKLSPDTTPTNYMENESVGETDARSLSSSPMLSTHNIMSLKLPTRRSGRAPVPVKFPGSSPEKPPPRTRGRPRRPLPTALTRRNVSLRGRVQKKRALQYTHSEDNPESDPSEMPLSSKPFFRSKRDASSGTAGADALLNSSMQLAYSWDSLGLGQDSGSVALNEYMVRFRRNEGVSPYLPDLTAQEMLQIMNSLRVRTYLPPPGSALHRIVQKNRFENRSELYGSENNDEESMEDGSSDLTAQEQTLSPPLPSQHPRACSIPFKNMARLYETMCAQDADDGSFNRREAQYLSASSAVEKLRALENRACELKLTESSVLQKGKELGLLGATHCLMPGYAQVPDADTLVQLSERSKKALAS